MNARNALREAQELVGGGGRAWVLEPSPPALTEGVWLADDPVAAGDLSWTRWLQTRPERADWASARWLGAYRRLPRAPASLAETRLALHRVAAYALSPARRRANGKIGLRWTLGGVGTPFFGEDEQVRIEGTRIVRQRAGAATSEPLSTLARAADLVLDGPPDVASAEGFDVPPPGDPDAPLSVDPAAAAFLGDWFGFASSVLEELRADPASKEPSRVQLWPEHFDAAFDCLPGDGGRLTFGASPGDAHLAEPYLYALSRRGELTTAPLGEFVAAPDQRAAALAFYRGCRAELGA